jgi:phenylpyruvate tautomerase PptA (4-oxalocrotonate tautomerase family)
MPFTRVAVPAGTPANKKRDIAHGIHRALVEAIGLPEDDFFQLLDEYHPSDFFFDRRFLGYEQSDALIVVQITLRRGRSDGMKRELYEQIATNRAANAGIRPENVFIYLSENDFSDWSVGDGKMSMAVVQEKAHRRETHARTEPHGRDGGVPVR